MVQFEKANKKDIHAIAECQQKCFAGTFIAAWPIQLIERYYLEFLTTDNIFIVAKEKEGIIGFCMGYRAGSIAKKNFLKKNRISLLRFVLIRCAVFDHIVLEKISKYIVRGGGKNKVIRNQNIKDVGGADLLSICVLDQYKGKGIATMLVSNFESLLIKEGIKDYTLSVYNTNRRAISFYKKNGMQISSISTISTKFYKKLM